MRWMGVIMAVFAAASAAQAETFVYVSAPNEKAIHVLKLNPESGELASVQKFDAGGGSGSLAVSPDRKTLFASIRTTSSLASFRIDRQSGKLSPLSTAALGKNENAAFVGLDRSGRWLVSASYAAGKTVVHRVKDGKIQSPAVDVAVTAKTAHAAVQGPDTPFLFVPHVATNAIHQFTLDVETGKLAPGRKSEGGKPGAGPRHLAFHPKGLWAYSSDETGNSITLHSFSPRHGLHPQQTVSTLPAGFKGKNTTAEVKVHPSGNFVWVSNRGHDSLAGFSIDAGSGEVTSIGQTPTEKTPRSFDIDPSGRYLFAAGEGTGKLATYRIANGKLTPIGSYSLGKSLSWVTAVDIPSK